MSAKGKNEKGLLNACKCIGRDWALRICTVNPKIWIKHVRIKPVHLYSFARISSYLQQHVIYPPRD